MKPYLVQRGKFKSPDKITGIDSLIEFDYMGSAEFEYGALPKALKVLCGKLDDLEFGPAFSINKNEMLWTLCSPKHTSDLVKFWENVYLGEQQQLKERLFYEDSLEKSKTKFWWDIENNWIVAIGGENVMCDIIDAIKAVKLKKNW